MRKLVTALMLTTIWALPASAEWTLDNTASRVSFVSTKAGAAAEVHRFASLSGALDQDGQVALSIDLDSVDTAIEIRDQRMREMLFETGDYPTASVVAQVDMEGLDGLAVGTSTSMMAEAELELHGARVNLVADMTVARLSDTRLLAVSRNPLIVNASQVGLLAGIERLREVAGLPSISPAVPVTFVLAFDKSGH